MEVSHALLAPAGGIEDDLVVGSAIDVSNRRPGLPGPDRLGALLPPFYPSKLQEELRTIDAFIVRWDTRGSEDILAPPGSGCARLYGATRPCLPTGSWDQRLDDGSRTNREVHVRLCVQ